MRASGILLPVFSLPSPYGVGTTGSEAYRFVDFLQAAGQRYWQLLPLHPTGYGDSPYQSFSSFAGNPYFIDPDVLCEEGLLRGEELRDADCGADPGRVDYGALYRRRFALLRTAFARFQEREQPEFEAFCAKHEQWLQNYALFMALKDAFGGWSWSDWPAAFKFRDAAALQQAWERYRDDVRFYQFLQFEFFRQWRALKAYARQHGVFIIGDMPMYVAFDSADVWAAPQEFLLDETLAPMVAAGCPPDAFSPKGQLWGNPIYRWKYMAEQSPPYGWWRRRIRHALELYDLLRIDHFRGFESYYAVPFGASDAVHGFWQPGPGIELFHSLREEMENLPIMAEDLGYLTPAVRKLLQKTGFPGMKVLQFAFDGNARNEYLPHQYERHCVAYVGTHDNDTARGFVQHASPECIEQAMQYLHVSDRDALPEGMMLAVMGSVADTCILTMQDLLGLDNEARINTPSTADGNWCWRMTQLPDEKLAERLRRMTELYGRLPDDHPTVT